jgi:hypothetical protein
MMKRKDEKFESSANHQPICQLRTARTSVANRSHHLRNILSWCEPLAPCTRRARNIQAVLGSVPATKIRAARARNIQAVLGVVPAIKIRAARARNIHKGFG